MFAVYLKYLRDLVAMPSVFIHPENCRQVMAYCQSVFQNNLSDYQIFLDQECNLIAIPNNINIAEDILYLSAHIDTVDAKAAEWDAPYQPFIPYEDDKELVGRGVNDCKAGVALQLFLSECLKAGDLHASNIVFTLTFKEEGAGKKTSTEIGKEIGRSLPVSQKDTFLMVLENCVKVSDKPTLCVYTAERTTYTISVEGTLAELQKILLRLDRWNPVAVIPIEPFDKNLAQVNTQVGGHVCSVERANNKLTGAILAAKTGTAVEAGSMTNFAVIPTQIFIADSQKEIIHTLVLSNRSFDSLDSVKNELKNIEHREVKPLQLSQGLDIQEKFLHHPASQIFRACESDALAIEYTYNVGASDASIIYAALDPKYRDRFFPIIMGPGSRSQPHLTLPRLTHGKNETFDKVSGEQAVRYILNVIHAFGFLRSTKSPESTV